MVDEDTEMLPGDVSEAALHAEHLLGCRRNKVPLARTSQPRRRLSRIDHHAAKRAGRAAGWLVRFASLLSAAMLAAGTAAPALSGGRLHVSMSGSDVNEGTANAPLRTIQRAADLAQPGTTVHVAPGVYDETIHSYIDGTVDAPVRFVSDRQKAAVIRPSAADGAIWENSADHVIIEGFEIDGSNSPAVRVGIAAHGNHIRVRSNKVHHILQEGANDSNGGAGIVLNGGYYGEVDEHAVGNEVHHIGTAGSNRVHGIYHQSTGSIVNNLVHSNPGLIGIVLWHDAKDVTIANNTVCGNAVGISVGSGDWYQMRAPADNVTVVNNLVYDNASVGIQEHGLTGTRNVYRNNLVYGNGANWSLQNGLTHHGTISADPGFVRYAAGERRDYRLLPNSPAIDAGTAAGAPPDDMDGLRRPYGAAPDIGAYEWRPARSPD